MEISLASIGLARYVGMQTTINGVNGMNKGAGIQNYALYAPFCSDVVTGRKYLDQGPLAKLLEEKEEKMHAQFDTKSSEWEKEKSEVQDLVQKAKNEEKARQEKEQAEKEGAKAEKTEGKTEEKKEEKKEGS